jgi:hypothetical protein
MRKGKGYARERDSVDKAVVVVEVEVESESARVSEVVPRDITYCAHVITIRGFSLWKAGTKIFDTYTSSYTNQNQPTLYGQVGNLSSALNFTNVVGRVTSHGSPCGISPCGFPVLSATSSAIGTYILLVMDGRGPPSQVSPNCIKLFPVSAS